MRTLQSRLRLTKLAQTRNTNAIVMRLVLRKLPTCTTELPVLCFVPYVRAEKLLLAAAVRAPVLAAPSFLTAPVPVGSSSTVRFSAAKPRAHPAACARCAQDLSGTTPRELTSKHLIRCLWGYPLVTSQLCALRFARNPPAAAISSRTSSCWWTYRCNCREHT